MSLNDTSIYVARDSRRFLSTFLNEMPTTQEAEAENILTSILQPILAVSSFPEVSTDNVSFFHVCVWLFPHFECL